MMIRRIFRSNIISRIAMNNVRNISLRPVSKLVKPTKFLFVTQIARCGLVTDDRIEDIDLNLQQACEQGEDAVVELMDNLKINITELCETYKECLKKEIEIIGDATIIGPLAEKWDDLPEYRSLAVQLNQELSDFTAVINTIGLMIHKGSMRNITQENGHVNIIAEKHKELETILKIQLEEIKNLEAKILDVKRQSILKAF